MRLFLLGLASACLLTPLAVADPGPACGLPPLVYVATTPDPTYVFVESCDRQEEWTYGTVSQTVLPAQCQAVPLVAVLGNPVPGTGTTHCTIAVSTPAFGQSGTGEQPIITVCVAAAAAPTCVTQVGWIDPNCQVTTVFNALAILGGYGSCQWS